MGERGLKAKAAGGERGRVTGGLGNQAVCNTHLIIMGSMQIKRLALFFFVMDQKARAAKKN